MIVDPRRIGGGARMLHKLVKLGYTFTDACNTGTALWQTEELIEGVADEFLLHREMEVTSESINANDEQNTHKGLVVVSILVHWSSARFGWRIGIRLGRVVQVCLQRVDVLYLIIDIDNRLIKGSSILLEFPHTAMDGGHRRQIHCWGPVI